MKNILLLSSLIIFATNSYGQTSGDYRSIANGNWSDISTWERFDGAVWQPATSAPSAIDQLITISNTNTVTVDVATSADQLFIASTGTMIVAAALTVSDASGVDLTVNGLLQVAANLSGAGTTTINGSIDWTTGTISSPLTIAASGVITISGSGAKGFAGAHINNGIINWNAGNIDFTTASLVNNGTINNSFDGTLNQISGTNTLTNSGSFIKSGSTGTNTTISITMTNSGTISVTAGTLIKATTSLTNTGTISIASGAEFRNNISLLLNTGTAVTGNGTMTIGGAVTSNTPISFPSTLLLSQVAGAVTGTGTFTINGIMSWSGGSIGVPLDITAPATLNASGGTKTINSGAVITNNGTITWSAGNFSFSNGTLNNNSLIEMIGIGVMLNFPGTNALNNSGTFLKSGGISGGIAVPLNNSGAITVNSGTLSSSGTFNIDPGSVITGTGTLDIDGTVNVNIPVNIPASLGIRKLSGTTGGTQLFTISGAMSWHGGSIASPFTILSGATLTMTTSAPKALNNTLTNNGTINWNQGVFDFNNGTLINNTTVTISFDGTINNTSLVNVINNSGNITKLGGAGSSIIAVPVINSGTVTVSSGTLVNNSTSFANTGVLNIGSTRTFSNTGTLLLQAGSSITGSGAFSHAGVVDVTTDLAIPSAVTTHLLTGSSTTGTGTITVNGILNWSGGSIGSPFILAASSTANASGLSKSLNNSLTNNGVFNWTAGSLVFTNGILVNNGTINQTFDALMDAASGTNSFSNAGIFSKSGGTGVSTVNVPTTNTGTINGSNTLAFTVSFLNNGTFSPGSPVGLLNLASSVSPVLTSGSNLQIDIINGTGAGTGHDLLTHNGNLVLDGTLTIVESGTIPAGTYTVINLPSGTISGNFSTVIKPAAYFVAIEANTISITKTILSVDWVSFTGKNAGNKIDLEWITENEKNNDRFEVEKSINGSEFHRIGVVKAKTGSQKNVYYFADADYEVGNNYYRLRQVDIDGKTTYSKVVVIRSSSQSTLSLNIFPNPSKGQVTLQFPVSWLEADVSIKSVSGQTVREYSKVNQTNLRFDLPKGHYFIQAIKGNRQVTRKLIIE